LQISKNVNVCLHVNNDVSKAFVALQCCYVWATIEINIICSQLRSRMYTRSFNEIVLIERGF